MNDDKKIIVRVRSLVKDYTSSAETLHILRGLDFDIEEGSSVSISGSSGSGKSTLLNILGGLDRADAGEVVVDGNRIDRLAEKQLTRYRRESVGFIFQFHYLLNDFTALENVMLPAYIAGLSKKTALEKARALLADVNMEARANHLPQQLSGGERQRVAVARSMVNDPAVILADEPTGNLDMENTALVTRILYEAAEKRGRTLVVVTHDKDVAARASRRYVLVDGVLSELKN
ncbi:MAG: ABC transporter ATP-binding protein [Spirochaetaceae bacterium]|jgi:lipoprotein-releasing system ATP-binding protein|nr:ABC transporter ATP-binding protein [Spirochaetaceae bacterium]